MSRRRRRRLRTARRRRALLLAATGGALGLALLLAPAIGQTSLDPVAVWSAPWDWEGNPDAAIFFVARLPRVLAACLVGASLALAGATFQSLLRNPLATPFTLGVSAGATLAAFSAVRLGLSPVLEEFTVPALALVGALATTALVMALARRRGGVPPTVLLLAGVTLNFTIGAVVMMLQYFSDYTATARMVRWMMGDLDASTYRLLAILGIATLPGWIWLLREARAFNLMSLGPDEALAHGVDAASMTRHGLLWASWITGVAVALAGPVGFVGIIVPHAVRLIGGADYRVVMPASVLAGAAFLVLCDAASRIVMAPIELPIGVITATLGGPFFLALLLRRRVAGDG